MKYILDNIQRRLLWWIFGAVAVGLLGVKIFGGYAFSSAICLLAALVMIYPSLVPLDFTKLKHAHKDSKIIVISLFLNFVVSPAIALLLGYVFLQHEPALWVGLMLISLLPGGGMATTWALKSKADMPAVIGIIFVNLIAAIVIVPAALLSILQRFSQLQIPAAANLPASGTCAVSAITGGSLSCSAAQGAISPIKIIIPIVFIVVIPLILAYLTQVFIIKKKGNTYFDGLKSFFAKVSNLGMVLVLLVLMGLKSNAVIFAHPEMILSSILPLALFYLIQLFVVMAIYKKFFNNQKGRSLVWGSYLRYITLALGLSTSLIYQNPSLSVIVVIIIMAYFVQIPSSFMVAKHLSK